MGTVSSNRRIPVHIELPEIRFLGELINKKQLLFALSEMLPSWAKEHGNLEFAINADPCTDSHTFTSETIPAQTVFMIVGYIGAQVETEESVFLEATQHLAQLIRAKFNLKVVYIRFGFTEKRIIDLSHENIVDSLATSDVSSIKRSLH
jgi:hypothetical protein